MSNGSMWVSSPNGDGTGPDQISPHIDQVVAQLALRFPAVPSEDLRSVAAEEFGAFDGAAITTFVPLLVAKAATARLTQNAPLMMGSTHNGLVR